MYVRPGDNWEEGRVLFEQILSGKLVNSWVMSQASTRDVLKAKRLVIKFVRGNLLLEWLALNMEVTRPILVIRHPCAIVASQLNKGWSAWGWPAGKNHPYLDEYPAIREKCRRLTEPEEYAALTWCIRYHAPLMSRKPYPFVLVSYEKLVMDGENEIKRICDAVDIPFTDDLVSRLLKPSDTVESNSQIVAGKDPLAGWASALSEKQVNNILAVLKIFDMDFYTKDLQPDYEKLDAFGKN